MTTLVNALAKSSLLNKDFDYHLLRASMVIIFLFFGYQKWFAYEAQVLIPYISNSPLISWMYPIFGIRGASWFLGVSEWLFGVLLFLGFWNKELGILGALGSVVTFVMTVTIIPFMPEGWAASAGGFPAMAGNVPFLMKDVVLLAVAIYLLKQDVMRVILSPKRGADRVALSHQPAHAVADSVAARALVSKLARRLKSGNRPANPWVKRSAMALVRFVRPLTPDQGHQRRGGVAMPNRPFIWSVAFEPDAIAAMSEVLEAACTDLSAAAKPEVAPEVAAGRIIAAAKSGERDPVRLRAAALAHNESD